MNEDWHFQTASTDGDLMEVVNERDEVIGLRTRRQVHAERLLHRSVQVCLVDGEGRIWLQLRGAAKDAFGGCWDLAATGHVDPGETYDQAARRELIEELGIDATPEFIGRIPASPATGYEFQRHYVLRWEGPVEDFNRDEIEQMRTFTADEINDALETSRPGLGMTPGVAHVLPVLLRWAESNGHPAGSPAPRRS